MTWDDDAEEMLGAQCPECGLELPHGCPGEVRLCADCAPVQPAPAVSLASDAGQERRQ